MSELNAHSSSINPFQTPSIRSNRASAISATSFPGSGSNSDNRSSRFKSQKLVGEYEKPWITERDPREKYPAIIFIGGFVVAVALAAFLVYHKYTSVLLIPENDLCLSFQDNFESLDPANWNHEIQLDGFGTGSFDWTTNDPKNSYVDSEGLHIVPTWTVDTTNITMSQIIDGYTLNLTSDGTCTSTAVNDSCAIISNYTSGATIPPVRSARLTTQGKHSIKYGKVEVVAKMVKGDWLWPAIWMLPEDGGAYGEWPRSGEIDIAECRGNTAKEYFSMGGIDHLGSTLHWGPSIKSDQYYVTTGSRILRRTDYSKTFNTYGLEWTEEYLFTYLNSKLVQVFNIKFTGQSMWKRGHFAAETENGTLYTDPWSQTGNLNTPFDQNFYLILNVAVGARNGYFPDSANPKPWLDASTTAVRDFALANQTFSNTWDKDGMVVKSVKMWSLGKC